MNKKYLEEKREYTVRQWYIYKMTAVSLYVTHFPFHMRSVTIEYIVREGSERW